MTEMEQRALSAYFRQGSKSGGQTIQPSIIEEVERDGLRYVRLGNVDGVLAIYRIRIVGGNPMLKGLKRWPAELN